MPDYSIQGLTGKPRDDHNIGQTKPRPRPEVDDFLARADEVLSEHETTRAQPIEG